MVLATKVLVICFFGIIVLGSVAQVHASVRNYTFEVINSSHTRLCTNKTMLTVNGQFPGPTIYARRGDLVIVDVINSADQNITIHWHGVKMPRNPWSDGPNLVTQCPITPGTRFTQRIILSDEEGTLWWHAHIDWTRATVYGAIIILPPETHTYPFPKPHAQVPIFLGEWWNADVQEIFDEFLATGRDANVSDAFLMNGQPGDLYPCSTQDTFKMKVEFGKTYLIRMVNSMLNHIMYFKIDSHNFTVVGTDAAYTKPLKTDYVAIAPGQTIDFLLEANQQPSHYYMAARVYTRTGSYTPTTGIIEYIGNYAPPPSPPLPLFPGYTTREEASLYANQFFKQLRSLHAVDVPKNNITETLFFTLSINLWPCPQSSCVATDRLQASINNVTMLLPRTTDILDSYYRGINGVYTADFPDHPPVAFNYTQAGGMLAEKSRPQLGTAVKVVEYNSTVEVVLQGTSLGEGHDHPIHFHGNSFYVVGSGFGNFDGKTDPATYNLVDPPFMESIVVPRNGWATLRFRAQNPGVWLFHCHFERHQSWGMKMAFIVKDGEGPNEKMLPPPLDMPHCRKQLSLDPLLPSSHPDKIHNLVDSKAYTN